MRLFSFLVFMLSVDSGVLVRCSYLSKIFEQHRSFSDSYIFVLESTHVLLNSWTLN